MLTSHKQIDKSRLGRLLVNRGYISQAQLDDAPLFSVKKGFAWSGADGARLDFRERSESNPETSGALPIYGCAGCGGGFPLQPMLALASGSAGAMVPESRPSTSQLVDLPRPAVCSPWMMRKWGVLLHKAW